MPLTCLSPTFRYSRSGDYAGDNCELFIMSDGRRFTHEYTFPGVYYLQQVDSQNIYWIKEEYCDPKTMELRAFLVTDIA